MIRILQIIFAVCAVLGGLDRIIGNRFGLGERFETAFHLMGRTALSMAGIICLAPVLADVLGRVITPVYHFFRQDPGMFGCVLSIDMGGYQMATRLADDALVGRFAGIIAASIMGCTLSFTIPVGMGMYEKNVQNRFARGILYGIICIPPAILVGALLCGIPFLTALWLCVPVTLLSLILVVALKKAPQATLRAFSGFAFCLKVLTTIGLFIGVFQYMTGIELIPGMTPVLEAMRIISIIAITLLGVLPFSKILHWLLKKPMDWIGSKLKIGGNGVMAFFLFYLDSMPGLIALPDLNPRGQIAAAAAAVCACSALSSHFAFTMACERELTLPLLAAKLTGSVIAAALALMMTRNEPELAEGTGEK